MATDRTPLPPKELDRIYRTLIRPLLFGPAGANDPDPTLILLGGQAGAGKTRASARLVTQDNGTITPLSGDDLRIFHPDYRTLIRADPERAGPPLADATRTWVRTAIQDALDSRRSLLLEGSFGDPATTMATADRFRAAGFHIRFVAIASPRVLSIVTAASRYLRDLRAGAPARFTRLSVHDRGYEGTARLAEMLDNAPIADRVAIISRNGPVLYERDPERDAESPIESAATALTTGRHPSSWGARSTMELLGELKQITAYAISSNHLSVETAELLTEAHRLTLRDVVPRLNVDADSPQARFIRQATLDQSALLNRAIEATAAADQPMPARAPQQGPVER